MSRHSLNTTSLSGIIMSATASVLPNDHPSLIPSVYFCTCTSIVIIGPVIIRMYSNNQNTQNTRGSTWPRQPWCENNATMTLKHHTTKLVIMKSIHELTMGAAANE
ncbi:hypothetical protein FRC12_007241 [Ceratobasidium sp. 428]|nr:hypothetical protein FRC12_007241 [Ceratobasidium sp. 428]